MAATRRVYHTLRRADNTAWSNAVVLFELQPSVLDGEYIYAEHSVSGVSNGSGQVEVQLVPGSYTVTFPSGENYRIAVPTGTGDLALSTLLTPRVEALDDETWRAYQNAVREYSQYRPLLVPDPAYAPTAGQVIQTPPAGVVGVEYIDYGPRVTLAELYAAAEADQGWSYEGNILYLVPAPAAGTTLAVVWRQEHIPDETTQSCPTIPQKDQFIIELLKQANLAEKEQAAIEAGLSSYTIGGTTIKWSQQGGGTASKTTIAQRLRNQALALLREPMADWG